MKNGISVNVGKKSSFFRPPLTLSVVAAKPDFSHHRAATTS